MEDSNKKFRYFGLTNLAVNNRTSVIILTLLVLILGMAAYTSMPKESFPEIVQPTIYVGTPYPGNSAKEMENLITRPIEKEVKTISGVKNINSTCIQDFSNVIVEFNTDVDVDEALMDVKDAVDRAKSELPTDLPQDPDVFEINFSEFPFVTVNLSGNLSMDELRGYAEYLQDKIEALPEISKAEIKGALEREVRVDVDLLKMESLKISFQDIENAISSENLTMSGGSVLTNDFRRDIRVVGEFKSPSEIKDVIVKAENANPVYLRDFADVSMGFQEATSYSRADKLPVVSLNVVKRSGENLLNAADKMRVIVDEAKETRFPKELTVNLFSDQSVAIRKQVSELENSIISGVILVVVVLLFFLGFRNALFVGIAIPLSMLMGIMFLNATGNTLNMVVLFSLILALGLLVDNAIVVVENIYRYMQEGFSSVEAAKRGAGEVATPIIASTATTLAAFVPLAFWPGLMGSFMKYLPITLIVVLVSSLIVALVINPVLTAVFMKVDAKSDDPNIRRKKMRRTIFIIVAMLLISIVAHFMGSYFRGAIPDTAIGSRAAMREVPWVFRNIMWIVSGLFFINYFLLRPASFFFQNWFLPRLEAVYDRFIRLALHKKMPYIVFGGTFILLFAAIGLFRMFAPKVEFFPAGEPLYVNLFIQLPLGTDIEKTNEFTFDLESKVHDIINPYKEIVESVLVQIGEGTGDPSQPSDPGTSPEKARITVSFVQFEYRNGISTSKIMNQLRDEIGEYPGVQIIVDKNAEGPPTGKPISIEITGEEIDDLTKVCDDVVNYLERADVPGVEELTADVQLGKPELIVSIDREAARRFEISTYNIAMGIRTALFGKEISKFKQGEDEYPVQVRLNKKYRNNIDALLGQKVTFRNPSNGQIAQVPMSAVTSVEYSSTYSSIRRKDMDRVITISSNVLADYNPTEVVGRIKELMQQYDLPQGMTYSFGGEQEEQAENSAFLMSAFMFALAMIFLIIVAQFNSLTAPIIILFSIIFSTIGVFLGYILTGSDFIIIMTGVGIISLAGIVVNNAIVLLDYIILLRRRKREELNIPDSHQLNKDEVRQAIVQGGKTRLRPVLLTAITTVLGLIPLAIGVNINFVTLVTKFDPQWFLGGDNVAFWGPMAWTVIYGLVFATFLTLVVVPAMYWVFYRLKERIKGALGRGKPIFEQ